ncbi:hypothetical protein AB0O86_31325 [Streptomyces hirsutus]|uniref:hypothetical protein n=1 Tax=Streptomyces hirsutus TaxID=35620 RepID=UPI0034123669
MTTVAAHRVPGRLGRFTLRTFRPQIYVTYGVLWVCALEGSAVALTGTPWRPTGATCVRAVSVVLVLLFLRMLDEQKDLEYDRVHHPERPLVTGAISAAELRGAMAVLAVVAAGLNAALSATAVLLVLAAFAHGLLAALLERVSAAVRDRQLLNLAVVCPVQVLLGCYVYGSTAAAGTVTADWRGAVLIVLCVCVFLHFEFARKTAWEAPPGARLYSADLGTGPSVLIVMGLVAGAVACQIVLFAADGGSLWPLSCLPAVLPLWGARRFSTARRGGWPLLPATGFVLGTHLALALQAVALR